MAQNPSVGASAAAIRPQRRIPRLARSPERDEMGSTRPGGSPRDGGGGSSIARGDAGPSKVPRTRASGSSTISNSATSSKKGAQEQMTEPDRIGNVSSSSKRRKRMDTRSYRALFKPSIKANSTDVVVATPGRVGKENTSSGHVADSNIGMLCEGGRLIEKNKRHSSDPVCKVSKSPISGSHETSETRVNQCTTPFSEVQPREPADTCPQNKVAESSLAVEARNRPTGPARQCFLSSLQSAPISPIRYEEPNCALGDGESISIQKEDSASRQLKVTPSDETDGDSNICVVCGTPGILQSCDGKGCKRRYHVSCLDLSLESLTYGIWFCTICTKKRLQFGIHSIVDGIESVWDAKEGMQNGKQYFVKYKNLAHVHNRWVPEADIVNDTPGGPDLLSLFSMRNHKEKTSWKEEWTEPHRLLRKRLLIPPKLADDLPCSPGVNFAYCNCEWLVKWRGLGYDHATWELETSPFLCTREADELKKNYENRREAAKQSSIPTKTKKVKQSPFQKLERLPDGCHPDFDNDHLYSINQLREFWHKSHGAVLVDDKDRVMKTILFIMSVLPDVCQPFLIVTTPTSLSLWEVQFNHFAPFINVVVYDGGKDILKLIHDLEFYENESCIMLQVLLSHPDAILEDIETIGRIGWEAVIVDYYQNSDLKYLEQLKQLSTDFRVLLLSSPIKDNLLEYVNLLAFLNSGEEDNSDYVDTADALVMSKARFTRHIAYERKADSSNFLEHWVPAYISQVQLKIYCSILLSNSSVLQSRMKSGSVGAILDIFLSLSKCCDHPYLVDEFLRSSLVNNHDVTDTRVHASGKLLLLDKVLKEIRNKRLRVIILFQSGGAGGNPMGNILEDVVCNRFGPESYERVECGALMSRKQAAINMFNDKTKGRFVFLIENRACLPSIKLLSIDAIIIYGSDQNPLNDLKALQKIKIESQFKCVSIFRLYTPFTVEEKSLVLAKQGMLIDSNIQDIMPSLGHSLLSWGASFFFNNFDELQQDNYASIISERGTLFMDNVISEFLTKLSTNVEDSTKINSAYISEANMSGKFYSRNITLIGEKEIMSALDGDPSKFWLNLLDGKSPCWSYISEPPQSSHRMLQNMEEPAKVPAEETDEARRKRRKVGEIMGSSSKVLSDNSNDNALPENCTTLCPALQPLDDAQQKLGVENLISTPKNLHVQLKQELSKIIKVLQLPDNVSILVERLFEYLLKNHLVAREPKGILHAFNIALCWRAASLLNYKVDRRESLALAEKCLNYEYNEELAGLVYDKLRILKKKFSHKAGETSRKCRPMLVENTTLSLQETSINLRNGHMFPKEAMDLHGNFKNGAPQEGSFGAGQMVSQVQDLISVPETHKEYHLPSDELPNMIVEKSLDLVDNVFSLREKYILDKQQLGISELEAHTENKLIRLKEVCNLVLEYICRSHIDEETRNEKTKIIVQWFTMLMYAFLEHMRFQHNKLEAFQSNTWSRERQLKEKLQQEAKSGQLDQTFDRRIALPDSSFVMEDFIHFKEENDYYHVVESSVSDCQQPSNDRLIMEITLVRNVVPSEPISTWAVRNGPADALEGSGGGPASEAVDFPENIIRCSSDGVGLQRAGCSSSAIPANGDSINQESSTGECRSTEHVERDNIANPSMLLGGATSLVTGVNANNDGTVDADRVHLEPAILASSQSLTTLSVSREDGNQANLSPMPAPQTVGTLQHPPAQAEPTNTSGVMAARDLHLEVQTPTSTLDAPFQRTCPDGVSQTGHQPDTAIGLSQEITTSYHLALGDVNTGVKAKNDDTVAADTLHSETQSYTALHNPAALPVAREVQTQTYQLSMPAQQSTSLPPQQKLATSRHPPAEAEPANILGTEAARDLQPGMQPSASMLGAPLQRMHPDDSSQTEHQPGTTSGLSQGGGTSSHLGDVRKGVDANNSNTVCAGQAHSETPTFAAPQSSALFRVSREVETRANLSSMSSQESTDLLAQQNVAPSRHQPAEAERTGLLGTQAARDLQPEMQPSTSFSDAPVQRMHPDDRSQTSCQPDRATGLSQGGAGTSHHLGDVRMGVKANNGGNVAADPLYSESLTHTAHNPATLVSTEVETQTCQSSMPAQQSTSPPAQQSLVISRHPPAEPEPAGILDTEAARDLQPEMQPSTSMQDQPEEAERAGMLGTAEARDLQPEIQPSISTQDVPFERTDLSHMPVLQSMTVHESVEPSCDPHAGVEPAGNLGMETVHDLQSEIQPSTSMQDRPAEAEGAGMSGTTAAQDFQPEMQPSTTMQHLPLERTHSEDRSQIGFQPNVAPGPEQPTQLLPVAAIVSNYRVHSDEPLKNELEKLLNCSITLNKSHEQKKSQLVKEYNQEIAKVKRKYDSLLQEEDSNYLQIEMELDDLYRKVFVNQSLAENFRGKFTLSTAAQGRSTGPIMGQPLQSSQQARTSASQTTASPIASPSATRPPVFTSFHSPGPNIQPSLVARRPPSSRAVQPPPILPGNLYRATSSPFVSMPRPHGNYGAAGAQTRAPAPHLQQPRMPPPYTMVHTNQQQLPVSPGVASFRQFAPCIMENFASTGPQVDALLSSMTPSSIHQTMSSASNSRRALPASSLSSGPLPEFMANLVQSSSSYPIFMATQQPSSPNILFHSTSGPLDAAPGSRRAGAQIAGVNHPGSESASLNAYLTARLGLTSDLAGTRASAEVLCLSDDES